MAPARKARTQVIYTAAEVGIARTLTGLSLQVNIIPGDPRVYDANVAPRTGFAINSADGQTYLTLTYRRRAGTGFTFQPVSSHDLVNWDASPGGFTELSSIPAGDGLTEIVTVRVLPAAATRRHRFVRLRVTTP